MSEYKDDRELVHAIDHLNELLERDEFASCDCKREHEQLLTWLEELRQSRRTINHLDELLSSANELIGDAATGDWDG